MSLPVTVLDPTVAGIRSANRELVAPLPTLVGLRLGLLDNGKPNSDRFLDLLAERLLARGAKLSGAWRKPSIGRLAPAEMLEAVVADSDLVVTGVGDCAGCCSCSVQDGIAAERHGVATVVIVTTEFLTSARISATAGGIPDYPFTVIDHPLGSLSATALARRADAAMDHVQTRLVDTA